MDYEPKIEKITGFAGARFSECKRKDADQNTANDPLHKLLEQRSGEMFEGSESFTWIDRE